MKQLILTVLLLTSYCLPASTEEVTVSSPDGKLRMKVYEKGGNVVYTVHFEDIPIVLESLMGIRSVITASNGTVIQNPIPNLD